MSIEFNLEPKNPTERKVLASKTELAVNKFKKWINNNGIDVETLTTEESIKKVLLENRLLILGVTADEVIVELKKSGIIHPSPGKKIVQPQKVDFHKTEFKKLPGLTTIEDENLKKQLEENNFFQELEKDIFKNEKDLDTVFNQVAALDKENSIESNDYYYEFAEAGLIKGGKEEVKKDMDDLREHEELFKEEAGLLEPEKAKKKEKAKKVATIVERAIAYAVSKVGWFGDNISIEKVCQFNDIKRGVDDILEIRKDEDESSFMGLGIDVTYRGLLSRQYKEKLFTLLRSIRDGHKTKVKYFKNHKGQKMKEFAVPKIILYFNINDVKDLVYMIKNAHDPKIMEEFKNSPQKSAVMNQMIIQCEVLSEFAEESKNDIFRKYTEIVSSIKELAWENPDIEKILETRHEDEASFHMKYLIKEFKEKEL